MADARANKTRDASNPRDALSVRSFSDSLKDPINNPSGTPSSDPAVFQKQIENYIRNDLLGTTEAVKSALSRSDVNYKNFPEIFGQIKGLMAQNETGLALQKIAGENPGLAKEIYDNFDFLEKNAPLVKADASWASGAKQHLSLGKDAGEVAQHKKNMTEYIGPILEKQKKAMILRALSSQASRDDIEQNYEIAKKDFLIPVDLAMKKMIDENPDKAKSPSFIKAMKDWSDEYISAFDPLRKGIQKPLATPKATSETYRSSAPKPAIRAP